MKKKLAEFSMNSFKFTFVLAIILLLLILSIYVVFFNAPFYSSQFNNLNVKNNLGISQEHLDALKTNTILFYMFFKTTLQTVVVQDGRAVNFFDPNELSHMEDVRVFFVVFLVIVVICIVIIIIGLVIFRRQKMSFFSGLKKYFILVPSLFLICLLGIITFLLIDWESAFDAFHMLFFPYGTWSFSINSNLITLLPDDIFFNGAIFIGTLWIIVLLFSLVIGIISSIKDYKKKNILSK